MSIDKTKFGKLSPEERIRRLKLLEEEKKKEVVEIEELIKKSMQEIRTEKTAEEVAPETRVVDISRLFEGTEQNRLEKAATVSGKFAKGYQAISETYQAYSKLKGMYATVSMGGSLSKEDVAVIGVIGERLSTAERYMTEGEKAASKLNASRAVLYKLKKETGLG